MELFGVNGYEFLLLVVIAVIVLGPDRLPEYAAKLARGIHKMRVMAEGAKGQLKEQLGPDYDDINWRQYDPRQYDPRRIVKQALLDPIDEVMALTTGSSDGAEHSTDDAGHAQAVMPVDPRRWDPTRATPWDLDAT